MAERGTQDRESSHLNCYRGAPRRVTIPVTGEAVEVAQEASVSPASKREYTHAVRQRYTQASRRAKSQILTEFCAVTGYHRKAAIRVLAASSGGGRVRRRRRGRPSRYGQPLVRIVRQIWEAAGSPWSVRLKALLPLWLPWAKQRFAISPALEQQLGTISASTIDRHLRSTKQQVRRRLYGRTKPGTMLKHQIPVRTEHWDVTAPGFAEVDLVSHSGDCADGECVHSLNLTDIFSGWVETRAVLGKGQAAVAVAIEEMRRALPFRLQGVDSDNGSEFINYHLYRYCAGREIQFTRGRPYKKDDNAHIEQKNWTHVRRLLGWDRYDSGDALTALNDLYRHELRLMMNLFQPSVKLQRKTRVGARLRRVYDVPQTPLDRLLAAAPNPALEELRQLRARLDPFELAATIEQKLRRIQQLAHRGAVRAAPHPSLHQRFEIRRLPMKIRPTVTVAR
jgi:hypothetical protein